MTTTRARDGRPLHFPGSFITDPYNVLIPPPLEHLIAIADDVAPSGLPFFARSVRRARAGGGISLDGPR